MGTERAAERFSNSLEELQEALAEQGLAAGMPGDLVSVAQRLASAGPARERMAATLRNLLTRSGGGLSRAQLATLLVVAAGGTDRYDTAAEVDAVSSLDGFVDAVMSAWERQEIPIAAEISATAEKARTPETAQKTVVETGILSRAASDFWAAPVPHPDSEPRMSAAPESDGQEDEVARAVEPFWGVVGAPKTATGAPSNKLHAEDEGAMPFFPVGTRAQGGRAGWLMATAAAALLAVAGGMLWRHREVSGPPQTAQADAQTRPNALQPETAPPIAAVASGEPLPGAMLQPKPVQTSSSLSKDLPVPGPAAAGGGKAGQPTGDKAGRGVEPALPSGPPAAGSGNLGGGAVSPRGRGVPRSSGVAGGVVAGPGSAGPAGQFLVSSGVMANNLIAAPQPAYPKMAKMWGVQGDVILQAVISRKGQVVSAHVLDGHHMLRGAATNAVKKWRYRPYLVRGKATDVDTVVIVNFHLPS